MKKLIISCVIIFCTFGAQANSNISDMEKLNRILEASKNSPPERFKLKRIDESRVDRDVVCIDNILYFVGKYRDGISKYNTDDFVSTAKIDSKTMQPQTCE